MDVRGEDKNGGRDRSAGTRGEEGWGYTPGQCQAVNFVVIDGEFMSCSMLRMAWTEQKDGSETVSFKMHPTPLGSGLPNLAL